MTEPVAAEPACLCGLDTNPVASPRMDIHCPKHDAPELGGEPGLPKREEVARTADDLIAWKWAQTLSEDEKRVLLSGNIKRLQTMITAALAEARRAGTPTTDARERAEVLNKFSGLPHRVHTALHNLWTRAVGSNGYNKAEWRELDDALHEWGYANDAASALSSTPSDETAQRARAAAGDVARFIGAPSTIIGTERLAVIIERYFTATDVEQGKCTWTCEPNPDIEMWETDCGNAFQFEVGGPTENKMQFCCYCGKWLVEKTAEGREEGEEDG